MVHEVQEWEGGMVPNNLHPKPLDQPIGGCTSNPTRESLENPTIYPHNQK